MYHASHIPSASRKLLLGHEPPDEALLNSPRWKMRAAERRELDRQALEVAAQTPTRPRVGERTTAFSNRGGLRLRRAQ
jgi:hypothetical protein